MTDRPYTELPEKDPEAVLDYQIDLAAFIGGTYVLDDESVEIESAGNGESPIELTATDVRAVPGCLGGNRNTAVFFWLHGGTEGVRYTGKITASDNASSSPDRVIVHRFTVRVAK